MRLTTFDQIVTIGAALLTLCAAERIMLDWVMLLVG